MLFFTLCNENERKGKKANCAKMLLRQKDAFRRGAKYNIFGLMHKKTPSLPDGVFIGDFFGVKHGDSPVTQRNDWWRIWFNK